MNEWKLIIFCFISPYFIIDLIFPSYEIIKSIYTKQYYTSYSILPDLGLTGVLKRIYIKLFDKKIYKNALESFTWLKLTENQLERFFLEYKVTKLDDRIIILEMCNKELGLEYDIEIIGSRTSQKYSVMQQLLSINPVK